MKYLKSYNESIRDKMKPKSEEDVLKSLSKLDIHDRFMYAIEYGVFEEVKKLIEEDKVDIHESNERALELSIYYNHDDIIEYLLDNGADPNAQNGRLMRHPIDRNNMKQIKMLLDAGYDLNATTDWNSEMLGIAIRDDKPVEMVELFFKYGARTTGVDMISKMYPKYTDVLNKYRDNKYNKDTITNESIRDKMIPVSDDEAINKIKRMYPVTGFFTALEHGYLDIAKEIYKENDHLIDVDRTDGLALEEATRENRTDIVEYLFSLGANPNYDGGRSIRYVLNNNNIEMLKLFLDNGYNLVASDGYCDALHVAKRDRRYDMVKLIEKYL